MNLIDIFTWVVLLIMVAVVVGIFIFMGLWPGIVARRRHHPQADAITIGSWVTLLFGFVLWPVVLIWAYTRPADEASVASGELRQQIDALEARVAQLESDPGGAQ